MTHKKVKSGTWVLCLKKKKEWGGEERSSSPSCSQLGGVCVCLCPQCIWPFMLSAVGAQFLTFTMIYDSSVPTITPRKVFASLPVGLTLQRTVRHLNASESCWRCSYSISSTSPTRIKTTWVRFFHFQETKDHIPLCCPFFIRVILLFPKTLAAITAYFSLSICNLSLTCLSLLFRCWVKRENKEKYKEQTVCWSDIN